MSHASTARYGIGPAPGGLALVQDLLNTRGIQTHGEDLLATGEQAATWLRDALPPDSLPQYAPHRFEELSPDDLAALVALRSDIRGIIRGDLTGAVGLVGTADLAVAQSGELRLEPGGGGIQRYVAAVWIQLFLAQQSGLWARLKVCRSEPCGSAFFDRSRNNSGVWHDVKTCGNRENLRASRARRRAGDG